MVWIGRRGTSNTHAGDCVRYLNHLLGNEFMPCMGLSTAPLSLKRKARVFAFMIYRVARVARGEDRPDERDHCGNKQIDQSADLLAQLFRQQFRNVVRSFAAYARSQIDGSSQLNVSRSYNGRRIGDHEAYALSTGNWGMQKGGSSQKGAAQHESRQSLPCMVSQLRRITMQVDRKGKHIMPRQVSFTSWGFICPVESPEGGACGLVKTLALLARICPSRPFGTLYTTVRATLGPELAILCTNDETALRHALSPTGAVVFVNGVMIGTVRAAEHARRLLVEERRRHALPFDTEIYISPTGKELVISAEAGGLRRPLII
jgi:DNA-directed RNA polymerase, beta subunit/140 kD subunit